MGPKGYEKNKGQKIEMSTNLGYFENFGSEEFLVNNFLGQDFGSENCLAQESKKLFKFHLICLYLNFVNEIHRMLQMDQIISLVDCEGFLEVPANLWAQHKNCGGNIPNVGYHR